MNDDETDLPVLKIVVVGESGVGKSNIISRYAYNKFYISNNTTIGLEFISKQIEVNDESYCLQVWDTAGQERFRALNRSFYRNALGAVLVFSMGDRQSFLNLGKWVEELKEHTQQNPLVILVGNKCDLKEQTVSVDEAANFAREQKMGYLEASAALNINIDKIFELLGSKIVGRLGKQKKKVSKQTSVLEEISFDPRLKKKKKCCE